MTVRQFTRPKNSHAAFLATVGHAPNGDAVLELREVVADGRGGSKDSGRIRFRVNVASVPTIIDILSEVVTSTGGAK
ncbi:hypothetical protein [Rhodoblastus sp.]|uniref:hypothetical protein n=1 Tax=Rhodoblastus sp. TaxID=1962975 RepID=UPI0026254518|nr:hypothetical protein [Rhodoblastus sp.]